MEIHVGLDDLDSPAGMCTTYLGAVVASILAETGAVRFLDYPYLVRLNPNIPFKTRGNGAVSLHIRASPGAAEEIVEVVEWAVWEYSEMTHGKTDPVAVVAFGKRIGPMRSLYRRAVSELIPKEYAERIVGIAGGAKVIRVRNGRGIVGAAAAIGAYPLGDFTFELIFYRNPLLRSLKRNVPPELILDLDRRYRPYTFANIDYGSSRILATPRGPDPVILGIRSTNAAILSKIMLELLQALEAERAVIYRTNQGTGAHLGKRKTIGSLRPYDAAIVSGEVSRAPEVLRGGHVRFVVEDDSGSISCMAYKPTGMINRLARLIKVGDRVEVGGGVVPSSRWGLTLNVECVRILELSWREHIENPLCPSCGARMESAGKGKGFRCRKCGYRSSSSEKVLRRVSSIVDPGMYLQDPIAYRHLSKPRRSLGLEGWPRDGVIVEPWHVP